MTAHTITGFLHLYVPSLSQSKRSYHFHTSKLAHEDFAVVKECTFETEIPEDFDPVPAQLDALNEKKRQLRVKLAEELAHIDDRISKLSALTFEPAVTVGVFDEVGA